MSSPAEKIFLSDTIPLKLAANDRLSTKAAIKRASKRARRELSRVDSEAKQQLTALYRQARDDIQDRIRSIADAGGVVRLNQLSALQQQVNTRLAQLERGRNDLLFAGIDDGARSGIAPFQAAATSVFESIPEATARYVQNFVGADGLQLSDRLWRIDNNARDIVGRAIQSHVIQGHSASEAAADFLSRGQAVPADIAAKLGMGTADRIARVAGASLMTGEGNPYSNALRVFRTEINRAHNHAYEEAAFDHPEVIGTRFMLSPHHPGPDICDMHARANRYGLGPGVYPQGKNPYPAHPNTISFIEVVFEDEVTEEDRSGKEDPLDWIKQQPPAVQEGVLGGKKKRAAFHQGLLKTNQIATPWRVLKGRYQRAGINVDNIKIEPLVDRIKKGEATTIVEADAYVLREGINTNWEHAWAFDTNTGATFFRKTSRMHNAVEFNEREIGYLKDSRNSIHLTHNHPSSSSLSAPDLHIATLPGVESIRAVGHSGGTYTARSLIKDSTKFNKIYRETEHNVYDMLFSLIREGNLSHANAQRLHAHAINRVLDNGRAIIYEYDLTASIHEAINTVGKEKFEEIIKKIHASIDWSKL